MVFEALDAETGRTVALRRFFPYGPEGGGLQGEERVAYEIAVRRLTDVAHPGLRHVVAGGCDPVDGMPFLVTEWVPGTNLQSLAARGPIPVESVVALVDRALEVSEVLSGVLAEDAVWVETEAAAIIVDDEETARGFTFWISPFKWLHSAETGHGLESLAELLKALLRLTARGPNPHSAALVQWLSWVKAYSQQATVAQARSALASALAGAASAPTSRPPAVAPATPSRHASSQPAAPGRVAPKPKSKVPGVLASLVFFVAVVGGAWYWRTHYGPASKQPVAEVETSASTDDADMRAAIDRAISGKGAAPVTAPADTKPKPLNKKSPFLGTWKYEANGVACTRTFTADGYCELKEGGKVSWKKAVTAADAKEVTVEGGLKHVLEKGGKTIRIEDKFTAKR